MNLAPRLTANSSRSFIPRSTSTEAARDAVRNFILYSDDFKDDEPAADKKSFKPKPLPNLDCNIICGNSLIDAFEGVPLIKHSKYLNNTVKGQGLLVQGAIDKKFLKKTFLCTAQSAGKKLPTYQQAFTNGLDLKRFEIDSVPLFDLEKLSAEELAVVAVLYDEYLTDEEINFVKNFELEFRLSGA